LTSPAELDARLADLAEQRARGVRVADEPAGKRLLSALGIASPERHVATTVAAAVDRARQLGFPVAVKVAGVDLPHKSDVGGVAGPLSTAAEVAAEAARLLALRLERPHWLLVESWRAEGVACFLGLTFDSGFGPLLTFGVGGIWVELLRDVSYRMAPVEPARALEMLTRLRAAELFRGGRGQPTVDMDAVAGAIERLGRLARHPWARDVLVDVDVNPLLAAFTGEPLALDCTVVLRDHAPRHARRDTRPEKECDE
jgi:acetate---CoA ligase (ADP-forming)